MSGWFSYFWGNSVKEEEKKIPIVEEDIYKKSISVEEKSSKLKVVLLGPGRNIPDDYDKYKKLLKCELITMNILTEDQLSNKIKNLKKVSTNSDRSVEKSSKLKVVLPGPGRNIPDDYDKYKKLLKCELITMYILTEDQLSNKIKNLKKVITNSDRPVEKRTPMMEEFFNYFEKKNKQLLIN